MGYTGVREPKTAVTNIHKYDVNQTILTILPVALHEHVGFLVNNDMVLVCGGTSSETTPHNPRTCLTHMLGSDSCVQFQYEMNSNTSSAHTKISDNRVFVIGGSTSDPWTEVSGVWGIEARGGVWKLCCIVKDWKICVLLQR